MKEPSSKNQVENKLDILSKVQKVSAPEGMYESILAKIDGQKKNTISLTWIRAAAAAILMLIAVEGYLMKSSSLTQSSDTTATIESLIPDSNNTLYND